MIRVKMRVRVPKEILNSAKVVKEISHTMSTKTGPELRKQFDKTIEGWDTTPQAHHQMGPVNFQNHYFFGTQVLRAEVFTYSKKYALVNEGSPAHIITPRRGGMLRFRTGYRAATRPRIIGSSSPSRFGNYISAQIVHHPGFEARKFDETIAEAYAPQFEQDMQDAIKRATP